MRDWQAVGVAASAINHLIDLRGEGRTSAPSPDQGQWMKHIHLDLVSAAQQIANEIASTIDAEVLRARLEGATWVEIADALGVSKQAAWERYRARDPRQARAKAPLCEECGEPVARLDACSDCEGRGVWFHASCCPTERGLVYDEQDAD